MKFIFITTFISSLVFFGSVAVTPIQAQDLCATVPTGSCTCSAGYDRRISVACNKCPAGTYAKCAGGQSLACNCVPDEDPGNNPNCGGAGQQCCNGSTCEGALQCADVPQIGKRCLTEQQIRDGNLGVDNDDCSSEDAACCAVVTSRGISYHCTDFLFPSAQDDSCSCSKKPPAFEVCRGVPQCVNNVNCDCIKCSLDSGVWTGLGCISFTPTTFIEDFLKISIGLAGGLALLLMIYGAFQISLSTGDPKKADAGKETITGAIAGLLFIIFSIILLRFIGVDLFNLPGF